MASGEEYDECVEVAPHALGGVAGAMGSRGGEAMSTPRSIEQLRAHAPGFIAMLGGEISAVNIGARSCTISFAIGRDFCHSVDIVQGGFITAMLDAAMSHAVFAQDATIVGLSSLEISTRYLEVARAGPMQALGQVRRLSHRTAFMDGQLLDTEGRLLATAHSVAKLTRRRGAS